MLHLLLTAICLHPPIIAPLAVDEAVLKTPLQFDVKLSLKGAPKEGRLIVVLGRSNRPEPRFTLGQTGQDASPALGRDVIDWEAGTHRTLDFNSATFPIETLNQLPAGTYYAQAVLRTKRDLMVNNAPGDLYGPVVKCELDPKQGGKVMLELRTQVPPETPSAESELVKFVSIESKLLSAFHGRPMRLRAGVILPRGFASDADQKYPLRVHIGGYGERFTNVAMRMREGSPFRQAWMADDAPRMILLMLDGAGPLGDPYQVNSANHGPYGDAVVKELIPFVEAKFRGIGSGKSRVLDGGSTGGWVSLALQVFYPEEFNGCWSSCPDGVDFRDFQLVNIYQDRNAYIDSQGGERSGARFPSGEVRYTMRHELQMENMLGRDNKWTLSGGQWGAWNATYGPKGSDGKPVPLWDPKTGEIDRTVVETWKKYDLRHVMETNWKDLGPKLRGKIHIFVGDADDYFLNNAVHKLDEFLQKADPPYEGVIRYGPGKGHCWSPLDERELMRQMGERLGLKR